ncbi:YqaJ viral recombinase family protein [Adlercreutzia sp. R25]|uniref:YqaJ viral recombinase family protein n=1 Tax=Adlercreutzia shanghongiae TaxID=3111773 RepID=UPI002DB9B1FB|nr:YqaJ viral recombinase family protein [Adlercreutzia sp. R25]MEC4272928.1 YqaJ viral recombinase family protein [Adlercreutzia sp. R25]
MDIQWNTDGTVSVAPPKRPKKMTGTRFASVLGLNRWNTPFQMWCEITGACRMPFEDTKYTLAGKAIEPKQIAYMREAYCMGDLIDPTDVWGEGYFKKTWGNFFRHPVLGGMWDALLVSDGWDRSPEGLEGATEAVLEFKTTKRAEDWVDGPPEYYALQASLYAWLLGCDEVIMVVTILGEGDYDRPEDFEVSAANTTPYTFKVSERYPDFGESHIEPALAWWRDHVETGDSPAYDERADADYLKEMRNTSLNPESDIDALVAEYQSLWDDIAAVESTVADKQKRLDAVKKQLKAYAEENIGEGDTCTFGGGRVKCKLSRTSKKKVDESAMKVDGVYEKYLVDAESTRFTVTVDKED